MSFSGNKIENGIIILFGQANMSTTMTEQILEGGSLPIIFICVVVISPIAEEFLFRKVLLERLLPYGSTVAIGISSILFGLSHFNFEQLLYTVFLGIVCANIIVKTGKIRYAI